MTLELDDVLVTNVPASERAFAEELLGGARIENAPLSPELAEAHPGTRVLACMIHDVVTPSVLEGFEALEGIVTRSDGYDHLPAAWMREHDLPGLHLEGYATESVAQHALLFLLALLRRAPEGRVRTLSQGSWVREDLMSRSLQEVTVGVLGVGRIGSEVARLVTGLGGQCVGYDIEPDPSMASLDGFSFVASFEELLEASDALSVHVPLTEVTRGMVDAQALERLPERAVLVNTARGDIVDQAAVREALEAGELAGYAADVLPGEPEPPDLKAFAGREDVLLTPHLAAYDERTTRLRYERTREAAQAIRSGDPERIAPLRII